MNLQSPLSAAEFLDVDTKEETEGTLTTDAFYNWFEAMRKEIFTEHDDSLDQMDTAHVRPPMVTLREGIHHAHLFLAALEQQEALASKSMLLSERSWTVCTQHLCPPPSKPTWTVSSPVMATQHW